MLFYTFIISAILLCAVVVMARVELVRGVRFGGNSRRALERGVIRLHRACSATVLHFAAYVQKDVVMKGLHGVSYLALGIVRFIERRLAALTEFIRKIRHDHS